MKKVNWKYLLVSLISVFAAASIGSFFNINETNSSWYQSVRPSITPPNWAFPIAWTILFFLIFLSFYISLERSKKERRKWVFMSYGINLVLNVLWTLFYFKMHNPLLAFIDIIILWLSIVWMIKVSHGANKSASYLLWPYLLWVTFAAILNFLSIH